MFSTGWTARRGAALVILALACARTGLAQEKGFVTQTLLLSTFDTKDRDKGLGIKAADAVRSRVADAFPGRELRVPARRDIRAFLELSNMSLEAELLPAESRELAKHFRADERILGTVQRADGVVRIDARMVLFRDDRLVQPYPVAQGPTVDAAAEILAREIVASRRQLGPLRRCENHGRDFQFEQAMAAGREGVAAYPRSALARLCLMTIFHQVGLADSVIREGLELTAISPANAIALELLAQSYEAVKQPDRAADAWTRLLATNPENEGITERVVTALSRLGRSRDAQPLIVRAAAQHPDNLALLRLEWLVLLANGEWHAAITTGESLIARDSASQTDPTFFTRMATAYRSDGQPERAIAIAATGVARFPANADLYTLYAQIVRSEADAVVPRGLAKFPASAELHVLSAQTFKNAGKLDKSADATRHALELNPKLPHGYLQLAQMQLELNEPDSALASLRQALLMGEERALVAQVALARGNGLYQAATGTQVSDDFGRAERFLELADSLDPSPQAKFLLGATALSIGQLAATDAPKTRSCELSRKADQSLNSAEINLASGGSASPDAAAQLLAYLTKLRPFVANQVKTFCA